MRRRYGGGKFVERCSSMLCNVVVVIGTRRSLFQSKIKFFNKFSTSSAAEISLFFVMIALLWDKNHARHRNIRPDTERCGCWARGGHALIKLITIIRKVELKVRHYQVRSRRNSGWGVAKKGERAEELGVLYFPSFFEAKDARNNFAGLCGILHNVERVLIKYLRYNREGSHEEGKAR